MKIYPLTTEERLQGGFTHRVVLNFEDLTETATATAQTILGPAVKAGQVLWRAAVRLGTPFTDASDAAFNTTTLIVGDDGSTNRAIASMELNSNGTEVFYKANPTTLPYAFLADNTIDFIFGSMTAKALNDIDAGEVTVFLEISDLNQLAGPVV